jgi:hypothetical protein
MDTLDDLGPQLHALTSGQPAQPGDRVPGVTRRARRIRRTRAAVAVAAAVAVLAPAGLLLSNARHDAAPQFARSDIRTWPDRSVATDRGIGEGAVTALRESEGAAVLDVRWLYRARVQLPDDNPAYVAVFTAEVHGQDLLVAATSFGRELDAHGLDTEGEHPTAPWDTSDQTPLVAGSRLRHIGLYLPYTKDNDHLSFALVLADPRARDLAWAAAPLPFAPAPHTPGLVHDSGLLLSSDGVFLADLGAVTGPVTLTGDDGRGHSFSEPLATGTSQPNLAVPDAPDLPATWQPALSAWGQTEQSASGRWTMSAISSAPSGSSPRARTALVRCYGGGTAHVALQLGEARSPAAEGDVTCDGESYQAFPARDVGDVTETLTVEGDRLQVLNVHYGSLD